MRDQSLTKKDQIFLHNLSEIDFGPIAFKLINPEEGKEWTLEKVTKNIEGYRRFLWLN